MSLNAPQFCAQPGCAETVVRGRCPLHARQQREEHSRFQQGATSYKSARWLKARAAFLVRHPLCEDCRAQGRATAANTVDHRVRHLGSPEIFWNQAHWRASCASCHSRRTAGQVWGRGKATTGGSYSVNRRDPAGAFPVRCTRVQRMKSEMANGEPTCQG